MLKIVHFIFIFILSVSISKFSWAQYSNLAFHHLSVKNGLSQGVNNCIYKDSKGYIWISSFDGLNRYDGIGCLVYRNNPSNPTSIKGTLFLNILEDQQTNLWIGSNEGLNFYDRKTGQFSFYSIAKNESIEISYSPFYIDNLQDVWFQAGQEIWKFSPHTKTFTRILKFNSANNLIIRATNELPFEALNSFWIARKNEPFLYLATILNEVWLTKKVADISVIKGAVVNCLMTDSGGCWIGSSQGLHYFNRKSNALESDYEITQQHIEITTLTKNNSQSIWVGTVKDGLMLIQQQTRKIAQQFKSIDHDNYSLSGNQMLYLMKDVENTLWIAVWGKGIDYVHLEQFRFSHFVTKEETIQWKSDNFIRSILPIDSTETWCGTQLNGILVLNKNKQIIKKIQQPLPGAIEHLFKDRDQRIWIATFKGLFTTRKNNNAIQKIQAISPLIPATDQFNFVYQLRNGEILAASNRGLYTVNNSLQLQTIDGVPNNEVFLTLFESSNGNIYVSHPFKGFSIYRPLNNRLVLIKQFPIKGTIKCFYESDDSTVWVGSTIGLIRLNQKTTQIERYISIADGLKNQYVYGIIPHKKTLWISTNSGISSVELPQYRIKNYTEEDGLQSNEFNTYAFASTANGEMLFGGVNGINSFFPDRIQNYTYQPGVELQQFLVNDSIASLFHHVNDQHEMVLKFTENTISFRFAVLDFINPTEAHFGYQLEGYDKKIITAPNQSVIRYANLPSGTYRLIIQAINADGTISKKLWEMKIVILIPWYKSWWFYVLVVVLLLSIIALVIRNYYTVKLKKQQLIAEKERAIEKERTRIATDMHDDFGANLSRIKFLSEKIQLNRNQDENLLKDLHKISGYSDEMAEKMGEIVWALNERYDSLEDLVSFSRAYASEYLQHENIKIEFDNNIPANRKINGETRRNIFLVIKESLHNIIKHAAANHVQLSFHQVNAHLLEVHIQDNGKGINFDQIRPFANGLVNMKKRMQSIGGDCTIHQQNGTLVLLKVPI
ncbi:MAG: ligand-binding sensor domain-containing protein [Ferruginibacter sp.]